MEGGSPTTADPPVYGPSPPPGAGVPNVGEGTVQVEGSNVNPDVSKELTSKEFPKKEP